MHQNSFKYYLIENETSIPLISEQLSKVSCCLGKLLSLQMAKRWGNNTPCTWHFPCIPLSSLVRRREEMHWKKKTKTKRAELWHCQLDFRSQEIHLLLLYHLTILRQKITSNSRPKPHETTEAPTDWQQRGTHALTSLSYSAGEYAELLTPHF